MSENTEFKIDLSEHADPEDFLNRCKKRYPDENVNLVLRGKTLVVIMNSAAKAQLKIDVCSFLSDQARYEIYIAPQKIKRLSGCLHPT